jgi:leucyl aminopeptidase
MEFFVNNSAGAVPIYAIPVGEYSSWLASQKEAVSAWLKATGFLPERGRTILIPDHQQKISFVLVMLNNREDFWAVGDLPNQLPEGIYRFSENHFNYALAFGLGAYRYQKYRKGKPMLAQLEITGISDASLLEDLIKSIYFIRDMINTPTEDFGPGEIAKVALELAQAHEATVNIVTGEELITAGYPLTYAVGRAAVHEPRMIDFRWGNCNDPLITLVGKGVCFDTGGLNLKPSSGMRLMKKDKAGAAYVLGLARLIIAQKLPVHLRVLIPAVENAVSAASYRPGEVLRARNGLSIEVSNTDAEGRLILADALIEAVSEKPKYLFDFASLTGAARVALGPELPVLFCNNDRFAQGLSDCANAVGDPLWRLPLYQPYREYLKSDVADLINAAEVPMAGAITAGLFLETFVPPDQAWAHFDIYAWNFKPSPGRPAGAEALGFRGVFEFIRKSCVE